MIKPENPENLSGNILKGSVLESITRNSAGPTPYAFRLNGGNPIALGFNVKLNLNKFNKDTMAAIFKNPDARLFPAGLSNLKQDEMAAFISQVEGPMLKWFENQQNMVLFTTNPIQSVLKIASDNKIEVPQSVKAHLANAMKMSSQKMRPVPGIKFNSVMAALAKTRSPK
jgi:hypothetical protein